MSHPQLDKLVRIGQQWRMLDQAHRKRNLAEYEGDVDEQLVGALLRVAQEVTKRVNELVNS